MTKFINILAIFNARQSPYYHTEDEIRKVIDGLEYSVDDLKDDELKILEEIISKEKDNKK